MLTIAIAKSLANKGEVVMKPLLTLVFYAGAIVIFFLDSQVTHILRDHPPALVILEIVLVLYGLGFGAWAAFRTDAHKPSAEDRIAAQVVKGVLDAAAGSPKPHA